MALIKRLRAVLIAKRKKDFQDGGGGFYCELLCEPDKDGKEEIVPIWAGMEHTKALGDEQTVEGYDEKKAKTFLVAVSNYQGKEKRHLVEVK